MSEKEKKNHLSLLTKSIGYISGIVFMTKNRQYLKRLNKVMSYYNGRQLSRFKKLKLTLRIHILISALLIASPLILGKIAYDNDKLIKESFAKAKALNDKTDVKKVYNTAFTEEAKYKIAAISDLFIKLLAIGITFALFNRYGHPAIRKNDKLRKVIETKGLLDKDMDNIDGVLYTPYGIAMKSIKTDAEALLKEKTIWTILQKSGGKQFNNPSDGTDFFIEFEYELLSFYDFTNFTKQKNKMLKK